MVILYTFSDKRPDFIRKQVHLFDKFLKDEFVFNVVNCGSTHEHKEMISLICKKSRINELNFPELNTYAPTPACSIPIQWCWDNFIQHDNTNISVIIDSDMFLLKEFSIEDYLSGYDMAGHFDKRGIVNYLWNGILFFQPILPNKDRVSFREGVIEGYLTDVGGSLYYYLKEANLKIREISNIGKICKKNGNTHLLPKEISHLYKSVYLSEFYEQAFYHYRAGSNWNNMSINHHYKKSQMLETIIQLALKSELTIPEIDNYKFHDFSNGWDVDWPQIITPYTRYRNGRWT